MFAWGDQVWVAGGMAGPNGAGRAQQLSDVWRFSPATGAWTEVAQAGTAPVRGSRRGAPPPAPLISSERATAFGGLLLVLGDGQGACMLGIGEPWHGSCASAMRAHSPLLHHACSPSPDPPDNDNRDPAAGAQNGKRAAPRGSGGSGLHALDLCSGVWAELPAQHAPGFDCIEALVAGGWPEDPTLLALGNIRGEGLDFMQVSLIEHKAWRSRLKHARRRPPLGSLRGAGAMQTAPTHPAVLCQVDVLDLAAVLQREPAAWKSVFTNGDSPAARTAFACALLPGDGAVPPGLVVHGGMLLSEDDKARGQGCSC
jgi:hypothetical protein